jgi:tetratricopeptide (TPR) repeat protein
MASIRDTGLSYFRDFSYNAPTKRNDLKFTVRIYMPHLEKDQILLSRFSLREMIGEGGMGQVWLVWDLELEIQIAIKILDPQLTSDPNRINLLKNECRNTRLLIHPNIVRVFDFHRSDALAFISMEYINGRDLRFHRSPFEPISTANMIELIRPVTNALGYAHEQGLVHRDVKAANILLDGQRTPRLTDFGIAGVFKSGQHALEITSGGSLFCMSPQQLEGHPPHPSDDIYALGILLYELFTGYPPFYPDITREKILRESPAPVNRRLKQLAIDAPIPDPMEDLIESMLAKTPADRPASMAAIENQFERIFRSRIEHSRFADKSEPGRVEPISALVRPKIITPVRVTPTAPGKGMPLTERSNLIKGVTLIIAFVALVAGGLWLWQYLPGKPPQQGRAETSIRKEHQPETEKIMEAPEVLPETVPDPAKMAAEKKEAENKLADYMGLIKELDAKGVSQWGNQGYAEMIQLAKEADRLFLEGDYTAAATKYTAAAASAQSLVDQMEPVLKRLLDEGQIALDEGNGELSQKKFSTALMIDPENQLARHSLQRAQKSDDVRQLLESGSHHEKAGKIAFAHADYQEALRLDPKSNEARQALARVKDQIRDAEFQLLMSEGLTALHQNDYQLARAKLLKAKSFRPQSREVKDALAQVDQSIRLARIESYRQKATAAEQAENWQQALDAYLQVLKIDANVQFATRGKERAQSHIRIDKRINFFLQQPAALESDRQLDNAIALIGEIEKIEPKGPRLKERFERLVLIVDAAQIPVRIIIESDTFTEIAVYKVGKMGRFESRELSLRPGTYTIVGTRDGYQDVRKKIIIKPGQSSLRVTIRCEVKI